MSRTAPTHVEPRSLTALGLLTLSLRVILETGIVVGLAYWGWTTGDGTAAKILLALAAPGIGFGFWGLVDFRGTGRIAEPLRLVQELVISGLAALAWYDAGQDGVGLALAALSLVYHGLVYGSGQRLLPAPD